MTETTLLTCDGCGQLADSSHISRRLERLAWTTRFRPVHIQTLLLSGVTPASAEDFLYAPNARFTGEAGAVLEAAGIGLGEKPVEAALTEFQKLGLLLTHVLECPLEDRLVPAERQALIEKQLPLVLARIRRSAKPKRVVLLSSELAEVVGKLGEGELGCPVFPVSGRPYLPKAGDDATELARLSRALLLNKAQGV